MSSLEVQIVRLRPDAALPSQAYPGDAGWDLQCVEDRVVPPGAAVDVPTGIAMAVPPGWYYRIIGRSSTIRRRRLMVMEGTIDAGFRGELFVCVHNPGNEAKLVMKGERLAQLIFLPVPTPHWSERNELTPSDRGRNGFGSSGK